MHVSRLLILALLVVLGTPAYSQELRDGAPVPKLTFSQKHPKITRGVRKFRKACHFVEPILGAGGSAAQIVLLFL